MNVFFLTYRHHIVGAVVRRWWDVSNIGAVIVLVFVGCVFLGLGIYIGGDSSSDQVEGSLAQQLQIRLAWAFGIMGILIIGTGLVFIFLEFST